MRQSSGQVYMKIKRNIYILDEVEWSEEEEEEEEGQEEEDLVKKKSFAGYIMKW